MTKKDETVPVWGYRLDDDGKVEAKIHETEDGKLPRGWKDTPDGLEGKK